MCNPTAQDYYSHDRQDDPGIEDGDRLLRRCTVPVQIVPCKIRGQKISDQIFRKRKSDAGASVDLECLLEQDGIGWEDRFGIVPGTLAMAAITAALARGVSQGVAWTPKPEEPDKTPLYVSEANPFHGEIIGEISRADGRALSRQATILRSLV